MQAGHAVFSFQYPDSMVTTIPGAVANNFMAAPAGHPFIAFAISKFRASRFRSQLAATATEFISYCLREYSQKVDFQPGRGRIRNVSNVTIYSLPTVYASAWNAKKKLASRCGDGSHQEDLERCKNRTRSVLATFWTMTWKADEANFKKTRQKITRDLDSINATKE